MGACCQRLDSIDHVNDIYDLQIVVKSDIDFFMRQNKIISEDKVKYFRFIPNCFSL